MLDENNRVLCIEGWSYCRDGTPRVETMTTAGVLRGGRGIAGVSAVHCRDRRITGIFFVPSLILLVEREGRGFVQIVPGGMFTASPRLRCTKYSTKQIESALRDFHYARDLFSAPSHTYE